MHTIKNLHDRFLKYQLAIIGNYLKQNPKTKYLPIVLPMLFYHGESSPYIESTDFFDLFENKKLAKQCFLQPFNLIDARTISDDEIKKHKLFGMIELVQKHIYDRDFLLIVDKLKDLIISNLNETNSEYLLVCVEKTLLYIMKKAEISDKIKFKNKIEEISFVTEDRVMSTMAEDFINEGMQQGIQQGIQQGRRMEEKMIALNMLKHGLSVDIIATCVGLSMTEIEQLKAHNDLLVN